MHHSRPRGHATTSGLFSIARVTALLGATAAALQAQPKTLVGSIRDNLGQPLAGAQITVRGVKTPATVDAEGRFVLNGVPDGLIVVTARSEGLVPVVDLIRHVTTDTLALVLTHLETRDDNAKLLAEAEADAKRIADRYERSVGASRSAKAFTDRDIKLRAPAVTTDLFVGVVGFTVDGTASDAGVWSVRDGCYPTVWVDEIERPHMSLNDIRPSSIKLLLAWNGYAVLPARLRSVRAEPTCGAVLVLLAK